MTRRLNCRYDAVFLKIVPARYRIAINTLTDADCRRATPNDGKLRKLFDGHGLMLAVLPSGNKVWRMAYRNDQGKQQTAVIGPYPLIGLMEARDRRDALRLKLIDGEDLKRKASSPSITLDAAIDIPVVPLHPSGFMHMSF